MGSNIEQLLSVLKAKSVPNRKLLDLTTVEIQVLNGLVGENYTNGGVLKEIKQIIKNVENHQLDLVPRQLGVIESKFKAHLKPLLQHHFDKISSHTSSFSQSSRSSQDTRSYSKQQQLSQSMKVPSIQQSITPQQCPDNHAINTPKQCPDNYAITSSGQYPDNNAIRNPKQQPENHTITRPAQYPDKVIAARVSKTAETIARQFSDVYEQQWSDAFQALYESVGEKTTVSLLLDVIQKAYAHCQKESEQQINNIQRIFYNIVKSGHVTSQEDQISSQAKGDKSLLVQFCSIHSNLAVERLQREFCEKELSSLVKSRLRSSHFNCSRSLKAFAYKAVELTWQMCMHDPPIYMHPTNANGFDRTLYVPYTKAGDMLDFYVWPALIVSGTTMMLLHKGVVQYQ